jgi:nicotinate-nucleotide adenylyltransferase
MTRVALFGGSFNPPHVAHQLVALYVLETQPVDELWFVPVFEHVFGKRLAPFEDRVAMCELAARALGPRVRVDRSEQVLAVRPGFAGSRTFDLIGHLRATVPGIEPRLVIGTDILGETELWHRWDDVVAAAPLIVIGRTGHPLGAGSVATGVAMPEISSTAIREAIAGLDPEARAALVAGPLPPGLGSLLPGAVLRYIAERDLYRPAP